MTAERLRQLSFADRRWKTTSRAFTDMAKLSRSAFAPVKPFAGVTIGPGALQGAAPNVAALQVPSIAAAKAGQGHLGVVGITPRLGNVKIQGMAADVNLGTAGRRSLQRASGELKPIQQARLLKGIRAWAGVHHAVAASRVTQPPVLQGDFAASLFEHMLAYQRGSRRDRPRRARLWLRRWARVGLPALLRGAPFDPADAIVGRPPLLFIRLRPPGSADSGLPRLLERLADVIMPNAPSASDRRPLFGGGLVTGAT
jgi:hypothetical protein